MENLKEIWEQGLHDEVGFWDGIISGTDSRKEWIDDFQRRVSGENEFPSHLRTYLQSEDLNKVKILDVGSGPHTVLGPKLHGVTLSITAVDPLAELYAKSIAASDMKVAIRTIKGEAESLTSQFGPNFDLVYSRNALDHSYDAPRALAEMLRVCKPGGYVFVEGASNEAITQNFVGLHQWNFMPVDGDLIVWRKNLYRSMRAYLSDYQKFDVLGDAWYQVAIQKREVPHGV